MSLNDILSAALASRQNNLNNQQVQRDKMLADALQRRNTSDFARSTGGLLDYFSKTAHGATAPIMPMIQKRTERPEFASSYVAKGLQPVKGDLSSLLMDAYKTNAATGLARQRLRLLASKKQSKFSNDFTPGEKARDKAFGKDYEAYLDFGGASAAKASIDAIKSVRDKLLNAKKDGINYTGTRIGLTPRKIRAYSNPESLQAQETVERVIQLSMRPILGSQFTENEGKRLIERSYNPSLDEKYNIQKLNSLLSQFERAAAAKEKAANYFERYGTLRGYRGTLTVKVDNKDYDLGKAIKEDNANNKRIPSNTQNTKQTSTKNSDVDKAMSILGNLDI